MNFSYTFSILQYVFGCLDVQPWFMGANISEESLTLRVKPACWFSTQLYTQQYCHMKRSTEKRRFYSVEGPNQARIPETLTMPWDGGTAGVVNAEAGSMANGMPPLAA